MKSIVLAFAALFGAASASVEILGQDNFDTAIASGNDYFVKLYAPWCGHCKRLAPTWDQLADEVAKDESMKNVRVGKVDCTIHRDVCSAQNVRGYPTLLYFKSGSKEPLKYSGAREVSAFTDFIRQNSAAAPAGDAGAQ